MQDALNFTLLPHAASLPHAFAAKTEELEVQAQHRAMPQNTTPNPPVGKQLPASFSLAVLGVTLIYMAYTTAVVWARLTLVKHGPSSKMVSTQEYY